MMHGPPKRIAPSFVQPCSSGRAVLVAACSSAAAPPPAHDG